MKAYTKTIPALTTRPILMQTSLLILSGMLLQSCIMTTVVKEIENTVNSQEQHYTTKGETHKEGLLTIQIQNNAENTMLQIDSMELTNAGSITLTSTPLQLHYGTNTSITHNCNTDTSITHNCNTSISTQEIKIHGTLHSYLLNNETYPIYSGTMYYPVSSTIPAATSDTNNTPTTQITISIHPNCPLYAIINGKKEKVLHSITFTATVVDWE